MKDKEKDSRMRKQTIKLVFVISIISVSLPSTVAISARQKISGKTQSLSMSPLTVEEIRTAEQRLVDLGYWTGAIDDASHHALIAFQKIEGRKRSGLLTRMEFAALLLAQTPLAREPNYSHVEIDLTRQVLLMIDQKGVVSHILPVSSGSGEFYVSKGKTQKAVTPTGKFTVCRKIKSWRKSDLGLLYYPNYICAAW
jgi:hypothetical protein